MRYLTYEDLLNTYKSREAGIKALEKHEHWLPLKLCPRVAGIVADLTGDGHLQKPPLRNIFYTSGSLEELDRFNSEIQDLFGVSSKIRPCTTNNYGTHNLSMTCKPVSRVFQYLGVPEGAKVFVDFRIPKWVLDDKECFRSYIKRLFDCEGSVDLHSKAITLCMWKEESMIKGGLEFFRDIKKGLFFHFGIITLNPYVTGKNLRKDGKITRGIAIKVKRRKEVIKYFEIIGFDTKKKQDKLRLLVEKIKLKKYGPRGI